MMMRALLIGLLAITSCGAAGAMEVGTHATFTIRGQVLE